MAMTPYLDNTVMTAQQDFSPAMQQRIDRLLKDADRLFSLGGVREHCQKALLLSHENMLPSPFSDWGALHSNDSEYLFAWHLTMSYRSTMDEIIQWVNGSMSEFLFSEVREERDRRIEEFARLKIASRWYQMKDDDVAWRVFSRNIPFNQSGRVGEVNEFFGQIDRISILTDILTGHAKEYGLEVDFTELQQETPEGQDNADLVERLKAIFYNNDENVRLFLKEITGMSPNDITDLVNRWVQEKRISDYGSSRKGDLWKILHEAELYPRTIQNWNRRVQ